MARQGKKIKHGQAEPKKQEKQNNHIKESFQRNINENRHF